MQSEKTTVLDECELNKENEKKRKLKDLKDNRRKKLKQILLSKIQIEKMKHECEILSDQITYLENKRDDIIRDLDEYYTDIQYEAEELDEKKTNLNTFIEKYF